MKHFIITLFLLLGTSLGVHAQKFMDRLEKQEPGQGVVTVTQSQEITDLVNGVIPEKKETVTPPVTTLKSPTAEEKKTEAEERAPERKMRIEKVEKPVTSTESEVPIIDNRKKVMRNSHKVDGYRVQVFAGGASRDDRVKAEEAKRIMKQNFPDQPVYTHFYSPRWICRIGNYTTWDAASKMLKKVKALGYPKATIVKGKISVQ